MGSTSPEDLEAGLDSTSGCADDGVVRHEEQPDLLGGVEDEGRRAERPRRGPTRGTGRTR